MERNWSSPVVEQNTFYARSPKIAYTNQGYPIIP